MAPKNIQSHHRLIVDTKTVFMAHVTLTAVDINCYRCVLLLSGTQWNIKCILKLLKIYIYIYKISYSLVQFSCSVQLFVTPWIAAYQASLSIINSRSLLRLMSIESVMPSNHLIFCRPLLLLPSIFPSIRVFSNVSVLHIKRPKYWSFSFSISPSNEYSGLISFRMDWLDSQEPSPTLFFKSINSSALSFPYSPTLTSIHVYWKNHSFDQTDLVWQSNVFAF